MATEVKLPDMGEGIEDVTINRWLVQEGETINEGDTLLEIATDKVDTEVPSPASGTVLKLNFGEGELVDVDAVLAVIGAEGEEVEDAGEQAEARPQVAEETGARERDPAGHDVAEEGRKADEQQAEEGEDVKATPVARRVAQEEGISLNSVTGTGSGGQITKSDVLNYIDQGKVGEQKDGADRGEVPEELADSASLSVRRIAADYDVDLRDVANGRPLGSLKRHDVLRFVAERDNLDYLPTEPGYPGPEERPPAARQTEAPAPDRAAPTPKPAREQAARAPGAREGDTLVPHTRMRTIIARNTSQSAFTAPHVTTMWDVDMSAVLAHRKAHKGEFAKAGVNLTITAYFVQAIVAGLRAVPAANGQWTDDGVLIRKEINIGMAVALPQDENGMGGLIVPVIKNVDDLSLQGVARQVNELAQKARNNQLSSQDLQGGTFTLTNYGTSGSRFQTPVIVQPQVGILGVGAIEKRPVVVSRGHPLEANTGDYLTFAPMTTLGFSYDHRVLDGATADAFCAAVKETLESWQ